MLGLGHLPAVVALALCAAAGAGCGDEDRTFELEFDVYVNYYADGEVAILVDGEAVPVSSQIISLPGRTFASYEDALSMPVRIETVRDEVVLHTCDLYAGACRGMCVAPRETASVCVSPDGRIGLNTWDCPCGDEISDWFCGGDCAETAP